MMDFLRDPIWQFAGFFVGVIGILVGAWASLRGRTKKLTYEIISQTPLLNFDIKTTNSKVKLYLGKKAIENAELVLIKIINIGSRSIKPDEYQRPLKILTGANSKILDAKIVNSNPEKLTVAIDTSKENEITFEKVLLNSSDWFTVQIIATPKAEIDIDGRIVDIKDIKRNAHKSYSGRVSITVFIWSIILFIAYFIMTGFKEYNVLFIGLGAAFSFFFGSFILPRLMDWIRDAL